jgi:hypothetical protein
MMEELSNPMSAQSLPVQPEKRRENVGAVVIGGDHFEILEIYKPRRTCCRYTGSSKNGGLCNRNRASLWFEGLDTVPDA